MRIIPVDNRRVCDILHVVNQKLLIGLVVILLVGGGVGFVVMSKKGTPATPGTSQTSTTGGNVFTSIKDALSKSLSLECMFTDEDGRQTKAYVKAGAVRSDFTGKIANESGSVIMKDKKIYFWNAQGGFMMEVPEETPAAGEPTTKETPGGVGDIMETMEQYKESCKPAVVADSLFTPPANITFQDFSQMMQQAAPGAAGTNPAPTIDYSQYLPAGEPPAAE